MSTLDKIINNISNIEEEIKTLSIKRTKYFDSLDKLIETTIKQQQLYKTLSDTKNIDELYELKKLNEKICMNFIEIINKQENIFNTNAEIKDLKNFNNTNKEWEGGKYPGAITEGPDGYRIRFDRNSLSFKYQNYKNIDTTIICESKEDCLIKAKKYLYDYYVKLNKVSNQYRFIHPKYIQVKLPSGNTFITNSKFIDLIENNIISDHFNKSSNNFYLRYLTGPKEYNLLYKLITPHSKVNYINGLTLDLREENLEETDNEILSKSNKEVDINVKLNKDGRPYNTWILGKYAGTVFQRSNKNTWSVVIQKEDGSVVTKTLAFNETNKDELYKKAIEIRNNLSEQYELTKNKIRILNDDVIEVKLSKDQIMKTDYKFLDIIEKYPVFSSKNSKENSKYYAGIFIDNKNVCYHNYITGYEMTDHIDRDPLNNCLSNLRECDHKINNNNRSKSESSKAIVLGVTYSEKKKLFLSMIKQDNKYYSKTFSVNKYGYELAKQMAIEQRLEYNRIFNCNNG